MTNIFRVSFVLQFIRNGFQNIRNERNICYISLSLTQKYIPFVKENMHFIIFVKPLLLTKLHFNKKLSQ